MKKVVFENLNEYTKHLHGGKGDDLTREDVDFNQLEIGIAVEMEHTNDPEVAEEIALDHLAELPDYYTQLIQAELADEPEALKLYQELIAYGNEHIEDEDEINY